MEKRKLTPKEEEFSKTRIEEISKTMLRNNFIMLVLGYIF